MKDLIEQARAELYKEDNCSCIILKANKIIYKSYKKGIAPLVEALQNIDGAVVADKIMGKAAALICAYGNAKGVYAHVMSRGAQQVLTQHGIIFNFAVSVESIINRSGTDICPMEKLVLKTDCPKKAFDLIAHNIGG